MTKQKTQDFLTEYRAQFLKLSEILREVDTVKKNHYSEYTPEARALAIELVERWIKDCFGLAGDADTLLPLPEERNTFLHIEEEALTSKRT